MIRSRGSAAKLARLLALAAVGASAPAACLFPSYTFTEQEPTGTTSSSSSSASASSSSSSSSGGPMEDCLDGQDNDEDGKVDCADPECAADYECVDPIPVGWGNFGYVALYDGANNPPDCPEDLDMEVYEGSGSLDTPQASCSACDCAAPTQQDCKLTGDLDANKVGLQPVRISNAACNNAATQFTPLTIDPALGFGTCFQQDVSAAGQLCSGLPCNTSIDSLPPTTSGGSCMATGGVPNLPTPTWGVHAKACKSTRHGGGCAVDQVCLPRPKEPFEGRVCVGKAGEVECPAVFVTQRVFYGDGSPTSGYDDTRGCTGCTCGPASGGTCEITVHLFSDQQLSTCNTEVTSLVAGGGCVDLSGNPGIYGIEIDLTTPPSGGSCSPTSTSTLMGAVTLEDATTFCCLP